MAVAVAENEGLYHGRGFAAAVISVNILPDGRKIKDAILTIHFLFYFSEHISSDERKIKIFFYNNFFFATYEKKVLDDCSERI